MRLLVSAGGALSGRELLLPVRRPLSPMSFFFFFNDTAPTEIYTLSLHDALPICSRIDRIRAWNDCGSQSHGSALVRNRSEEHTSELQSHHDLVCRLLLEKKKKKRTTLPK